MNLLQQRLKRTVVNSRSKKEALLKAGYAPETARTQVARTFEAPPIQEAIKKQDEIAVKRHREAFDAEKLVILPDSPNVVVPDVPTRLKAVDMQYKARGVYNDGNTTNIQINNIIPILGGITKDVPSDNGNKEDTTT